MKKILSVLLAVVLCFGVAPVAAFAAEEEKDIRLSIAGPATAKHGDVIEVTVGLEQNKGYATLLYELKYNKAQLELQSATLAGSKVEENNPTAGVWEMLSSDNQRFGSIFVPADTTTAVTTKNGNLVTYKFKVLANGTAAGSTNVEIGLQAVTATGANGNDLSVNAPMTTVAVEYNKALPKVADLNGDNVADKKDVETLLNHTLFPSMFKLNVEKEQVDYNDDGAVDKKDVEKLLNHTLFPSVFPIA